MRLPVALHATHGAAVTIWPRIERRTSRTSPVPPHTSQRAGWVPGSQPEPSQRCARDRQADVDGGGGAERGLREIEVTTASASGARGGPAWPPLPNGSPPKKASKMSPKPNASPAPLTGPAAGARAVFAEDVVAAAALGIAAASRRRR